MEVRLEVLDARVLAQHRELSVITTWLGGMSSLRLPPLIVLKSAAPADGFGSWPFG
jgi:hypothetical protein